MSDLQSSSKKENVAQKEVQVETKRSPQSQLRNKPQRRRNNRHARRSAWLLPTVGGLVILGILAYVGFHFFSSPAQSGSGNGYSNSGYSGSSGNTKVGSFSGCFVGQGQSQTKGQGCAQGFDPLGDPEFTSAMKNAVSAKMHLTPAQLQAQLFPNGQPGPSIVDIATQQGMTTDQWHTFALTTAQEALAKAVSEGKLKQPDANKLIQGWQTQPDNLDKLISFMFAPLPGSPGGNGY
jgi:hypothetical protein